MKEKLLGALGAVDVKEEEVEEEKKEEEKKEEEEKEEEEKEEEKEEGEEKEKEEEKEEKKEEEEVVQPWLVQVRTVEWFDDPLGIGVDGNQSVHVCVVWQASLSWKSGRGKGVERKGEGEGEEIGMDK